MKKTVQKKEEEKEMSNKDLRMYYQVQSIAAMLLYLVSELL